MSCSPAAMCGNAAPDPALAFCRSPSRITLREGRALHSYKRQQDQVLSALLCALNSRFSPVTKLRLSAQVFLLFQATASFLCAWNGQLQSGGSPKL